MTNVQVDDAPRADGGHGSARLGEREDIAQKTNVAYQQVVRLSRDRRPKRSLKAAREPKETKKTRRRAESYLELPGSQTT